MKAKKPKNPPIPPQAGWNPRPSCALTLILTSLMLMMTITSASAAFVPPSPTDTATFDLILAPVWMVYNLVKYVATAVAALFLVFAGVKYMMSGNDVGARDNAKQMVAYVIIGLIVIWVTPYLVKVFTA